MRDQWVEVLEEDFLRKVATIMGESSAAAKALKDGEVRRQKGQDVGFYRTKAGTIIVGPKIEQGA